MNRRVALTLFPPPVEGGSRRLLTMMRRGWVVASLVAAVAVAACAPAAPSQGGPAADASRAALNQSRVLAVMTHVEPNALSEHVVAETTGSTPSETMKLFNAGITTRDERGVPRPYIIEALPELNTDTWRVFEDGRMETTYRLRPNLTWHDGVPLSAEDVVLGWRVAATPAFGVARGLPQRLIDEVVAVDAQTFLIRWNQPYPEADAIRASLGPLPRHILAQPFDQSSSSEAFLNHSYFTRDFVGLGAYRLTRWEPGAFVEGAAFDGHALGRPKIGRIQVTFVGDPNAAVANLLAESAHVAIDFTLGFDQGMILRRQWAPQNAGTVLLNAERLRYVQVQHKTEYTDPRALLDLRVRKGLVHSIDKQALVDGLLAGEGQGADAMVPPGVEYYADVDRVITKHPYDLQRTSQYLAEAGFTRGTDGVFVSAGGERFSPELRGTAASLEERENAILADGWRRAGIDVRSRLLSELEDRDPQLRATYPALGTANSGLSEQTLLVKVYSGNIATAANRWQGSNRGGWVNAEYDGLYEAFISTLERGKRNQQMTQAMKLLSEELPIFPLYFGYFVVAHVAGLHGPMVYAPGGWSTWNAAAWEWR